jgi:hypothetical protein
LIDCGGHEKIYTYNSQQLENNTKTELFETPFLEADPNGGHFDARITAAKGYRVVGTKHQWHSKSLANCLVRFNQMRRSFDPSKHGRLTQEPEQEKRESLCLCLYFDANENLH